MNRRPLTAAQLAEAIRARRDKAAALVESLKGSNHPQIEETRVKCTGEVSAFEEVLYAIENRSTYMLEHFAK